MIATGAHIRTERQSRGWSMAVLGKLLGVSGQRVGTLERKKGYLTERQIKKLDRVFGSSAWRLRRVEPFNDPEHKSISRLQAAASEYEARLRQIEKLLGIPVDVKKNDAGAP